MISLIDINKLVQNYGLQNQVIIYNKYIPYEELPELLANMDAGVIGNRNELLSDYMLPVKLLEYVSLNIPVIVPKNKIISRYFSEDMVCYYIPESTNDMAKKILYFYENERVRESFSMNALKFTLLHNYKTEMEIYKQVLQSLLN